MRILRSRGGIKELIIPDPQKNPEVKTFSIVYTTILSEIQ
jgi:hypothetical protein